MKPIDCDETENLRVNLLTQEIKFAKMLAGNTFDGALKEKHIDKLSIWLKNRAACTEEFTDKDCLRIWKGLYYSMWMSDKPIPQENLANKIAGLLNSFDQIEASLQFFAAFLKTMAMEWNSIDQWRIDKFMMLVRKVTREVLRILQTNNWNDEAIEKLNQTLSKTVLGAEFHVPRGLFMHFTELFFEEVAKVSNGEIEADSITKLLKPFMFYVASQSDYKLIQFVVRQVFNHLLFQSESGREYKEKFDAWKSMNFPGKSIDELVLEEPEETDEKANGEEENGDGEDEDGSDNSEDVQDETEIKSKPAMDPRAGRVDVVMPEIKFDPLEIVSQLEDLKYKKFTRVRNRKCIDRITTTYKKFASGVFPIGIQKIKIDRDELEVPDVEEKAEELLEFENELYGKQRELKKINKRKRKKIVSDQTLFDEFQAKSSKIAKIKHDANLWTEEDITEENGAETPAKKSKKAKKVEPKETVSAAETPKNAKKHKSSEWGAPLADGEVEYFIPSKKQQLNGVLRVTKTADSVAEHVITPKGDKPKVNGTEANVSAENETPKKSPKVKKSKAENIITSVANGTDTNVSANIKETPKKSPKVKKPKAENVTPVTNSKTPKTPEPSKSTPELNSSPKTASDKKTKQRQRRPLRNVSKSH
ncbi:ribosomal RNA processing protein 1 homolog isoform X2 [Sitodiplosis mosellana]|uniref:ribosomal RNA processing protein 1 homolog isoform X2 n=1 Tax=Sitodiplosis mosellana TaxID=263140 RepID=UPI0024443903|nr:ribosomal RNA processing protein 1 homolog isoform X2 [Sitodiplosis mosellana]